MIGVFDSGFGGLEILREIVKKLPQYKYIYLGDTQGAPYGSRSQETIYQFTKSAIDFLFKRGCGLIIIACNTASAEALRKIQQEYLPKRYPKKRVLGVIIPACQTAEVLTKTKRIGVIATESAVVSGAFERELKKINSKIKVFQKACPLLVPLIEVGKQNTLLTKIYLKECLGPLLGKSIDTLILGCTHYGLVEKEIKKIIPKKIKIVSEGKIVAEKLTIYLKNHPEIEKRLKKENSVEFLTTDLTEKFATLGSKFFGKPIHPQKISL